MAQLAVRLAEIADFVGGELLGDSELVVKGLKPLSDAGPSDLSFLDNEKYLPQFESTAAGAVIVAPTVDPKGKTVIKVDGPYAAFAKVLQNYAPDPPCPFTGVSDQAFVSPDATIADSAAIGPGAYVGPGVTIGEGTQIWPGASLGPNVTVGAQCRLYSNVTVYHECHVGDRVIIHAGTVIGGDGFGFAPMGETYLKIPQIGNVVIGDDVEIGSNVTIDRAALGTTRIGSGTKIDNMVQIAHNCEIGENSIIVAQVGVSGSTSLGKHVVIGGQAGLCGHIRIGDYVRIGAQSGVTKSIPEGQEVLGAPAIPIAQFKRLQAHLWKLPRLKDKIKDLQDRLTKLEGEHQD